MCKEAIVTGQFPSQCNGNLAQGLARAYRLPAEKLLLAAQWKDAERVQVTAQTRLLVYRDNRLDENLRTASSYCALREDFPSVIGRVAQVVCRWVEDIRILSGQSPLVVLTGDHGFTYGPSPGKETSAHRQLDGSSRCVAISGKPDEAELADESLTYIDKDVFHLPAATWPPVDATSAAALFPVGPCHTEAFSLKKSSCPLSNGSGNRSPCVGRISRSRPQPSVIGRSGE